MHTDDPSMDVDYSDHDYCSTAEPAALDLSLDHTEDLHVEIARFRKQIEEIPLSSKFCLEQMLPPMMTLGFTQVKLKLSTVFVR